MRFSIQRVKRLEHMAAKMIFIILLIYRTFSNMVAGIIVHAIDFKDVNIEMGKNFTVLFADFD